MIGLGAGALLVLVIGGVVVASLLGAGDGGVAGASPTEEPSPTPTVAASVSPTPTPEPTVTPTPTPAPTPAGPPQEIPVGAWATVAVDELSVRSAAGTEASADYILVRGAVMHVAEGPAVVDGLNWYRIASLGGAVGWAFAGWVEEPFMTTLVEDPTLIRCGEVDRAVFDVVDGEPAPADPIGVDGLALPAAAFSDESLGALELIRSVGGEACISAQLGSDGVPAITSQLSVQACGHGVADGGFFRLRPASGQDFPLQNQVKDPAIVHPSVLEGGPSTDRLSSNLREIMTMISAPDAAGCLSLNVTEDASGVNATRDMSASLCAIVTEYNADNLRFTPLNGEDEVWIKLTSGSSQPGIFAFGEPVEVGVFANAYQEGRYAYAHTFDDPECR